MADPKIKRKKDLDPGIYANMSQASLEQIQKMLNESFPQKKKKAVRKEKK